MIITSKDIIPFKFFKSGKSLIQIIEYKKCSTPFYEEEKVVICFHVREGVKVSESSFEVGKLFLLDFLNRTKAKKLRRPKKEMRDLPIYNKKKAKYIL